MNIQEYYLLKKSQQESMPRYRGLCINCRQPHFGCYCQQIEKFDPKIKFVILIHPIEVKRRIATGRMAHLCLENSELIEGEDYTNNQRINDILADNKFHSMILYPGAKSINITNQIDVCPFEATKKPVLFVVDGTWATARKTMRLSQNLKCLNRICFTPPHPSQFRVRKQPEVHCFSTIEAIHYSIELLGQHSSFPTESREHDKLLNVFNHVVEKQLGLMKEAQDNPRNSTYRRPLYRGVNKNG